MSLPTDAATRLCETVRMLRHLAANLPGPVRLCFFAGGDDSTPVAASPALVATEHAVTRALAHVGVSAVQYVHDAPTQLSSFELFISKKISQALDFRYDAFEAPEPFEALLASFDFSGAVPEIETSRLLTPDGVPLTVYASNRRQRPPIVLALPCGMPFDLCRDWFNALSEHYFVVTWETRGLFGDGVDFDQVSVDTNAQVADLFAVMDHFDLPSAHLMGICGGAAIVLCAADAHGERAQSLSLWHGDYNLGDDSLRTPHQQNFEWLMETAAQDRAEAQDLQAMFVDQKTLATTPEPIAHTVLFPYVNPELFYRYARLNDALNKTELLPLLARITVPTLVVAGDSDSTTHIGGSRLVAQSIEGAALHVERDGSHLAFFERAAESKKTAFQFINSTLELAEA
ncbi:alpha/beta fold hydrolase [Pseudomonas frederiksbergensis]|uniref:alpha/beta fold hydrolase n=1 Tax=Pseudomonas frederiksbergensis TaxID=104087 RepID=UPI000F47F438|nr:alpha/beta hydrolase [Pseudomonas frederiksbergensis]RON54434.1 alpha/beta hydrolase [Pseudomonas frederiksbergensis]